MSLYDLATASTRSSEPILIIKNSAGAAMDDPQNTVVYSNSSNNASIVINPFNSMLEADPGTPTGVPPVVINTQSPEVKTALTKIARFIPTETVTIYLGALSASTALQSTVNWLNPELVYWVTGLVLTPLIFLLIWAIERSKLKLSLTSDLPYWKLIASVIGFLIWALAVPGSPYATSEIAKVATAFMALLVSIILDLIDQLFESRKAISNI